MWLFLTSFGGGGILIKKYSQSKGNHWFTLNINHFKFPCEGEEFLQNFYNKQELYKPYIKLNNYFCLFIYFLLKITKIIIIKLYTNKKIIFLTL